MWVLCVVTGAGAGAGDGVPGSVPLQRFCFLCSYESAFDFCVDLLIPFPSLSIFSTSINISNPSSASGISLFFHSYVVISLLPDSAFTFYGPLFSMENQKWMVGVEEQGGVGDGGGGVRSGKEITGVFGGKEGKSNSRPKIWKS